MWQRSPRIVAGFAAAGPRMRASAEADSSVAVLAVAAVVLAVVGAKTMAALAAAAVLAVVGAKTMG